MLIQQSTTQASSRRPRRSLPAPDFYRYRVIQWLAAKRVGVVVGPSLGGDIEPRIAELLAKQLSLGGKDARHDLCATAREARRKLDQETLNDETSRLIASEALKPGEAHRALARLAPPAIISFQIDDRLESALTAEKVHHNVLAPGRYGWMVDSHLVPVIKPFGHAPVPSTLRLTPADRLGVFEEERWMLDHLRSLLSSHSLVLAGMTPDETTIPLSLLVQYLRPELRESGAWIYLLVATGEQTPDAEDTRVRSIVLDEHRGLEQLLDAARALPVTDEDLADVEARSEAELAAAWRAMAITSSRLIDARGILPQDWSERSLDIEITEIFVEPRVMLARGEYPVKRSDAALEEVADEVLKASRDDPREIEAALRERSIQAEDVRAAATRHPEYRRMNDLLRLLGEGFRKAGREPGSEPETVASLSRAVTQHPRLVLLGNPALGKTTALKWLAYRIASATAREAGLMIPGVDALIPLYVPLRELNATPGEVRPTVESWLVRKLAASGSRVEAKRAARALRDGAFLLLFDGLDEVVEAKVRADVARELFDLLGGRWSGCRVVLSSRPDGYRAAEAVSSWPHYSMLEFDERQVREFLERWFAIVARRAPGGSSTDPSTATEQMLGQLEERGEVARLIRHPLLLTIFAVGHRATDGHLPERRVGLYDSAVQTMAVGWERAKHLDKDLRFPDVARVVEALSWVAFALHSSRGDNVATLSELQALLAEGFERAGSPPNRANAEAWDLCSMIRQRETLLSERMPGRYAFFQLTFQEYLAGRHLARYASPSERLAVVREQLHAARWTEVLGFAIAEANQGAAEEMVQAVAGHESRWERWLARDAIAAVRYLGDSPAVSRDTARQIVLTLINTYPQLDLEEVRHEAAVALATVPRSWVQWLDVEDDYITLITEHRGWELEPIIRSLDPYRQRDNLLDYLENYHPSKIRVATVQALDPLAKKDSAVKGALLNRLDDYWTGQTAAVQALDPLAERDEEVRDAIKRLDDDGYVRAAAVQGLAPLADKDLEVKEALLLRLSDKEWHVRFAAAQALSNGPIECMMPLIKLLCGVESDRKAAVQSLGWGCGRGGWPTKPLELLIESEGRSLRYEALEALRIAAAYLPALPVLPGRHTADRSFGEGASLPISVDPEKGWACANAPEGMSHALLAWADRAWSLTRPALPYDVRRSIEQERAAATSAAALAGLALCLLSGDDEPLAGVSADALGPLVRSSQIALLLHHAAAGVEMLIANSQQSKAARDALTALMLPAEPDRASQALEDLATADIARIKNRFDPGPHFIITAHLAAARLVRATVIPHFELSALPDLDPDILESALLLLAWRHIDATEALPPVDLDPGLLLVLDVVCHGLAEAGEAVPAEAVRLDDVDMDERFWPRLRAEELWLDVDLGAAPPSAQKDMLERLQRIRIEPRPGPGLGVKLRSGAREERSVLLKEARTRAARPARALAASPVLSSMSSDEALRRLRQMVNAPGTTPTVDWLPAATALAEKVASPDAVKLLAQAVPIAATRVEAQVPIEDIRAVLRSLTRLASQIDPKHREKGFGPILKLAAADTSIGIGPWGEEALVELAGYRRAWLPRQLKRLARQARKASPSLKERPQIKALLAEAGKGKT